MHTGSRCRFGQSKVRFTHSMPCPCHAHAVPLPCRAAKRLECVFHIWFTQCGSVWFTLAMLCPWHAPTMPLFSRHSTARRRETAVLCRGLEKNGMVGTWHGKCESGTAGERHGRGMGTAWERHVLCESALNLSIMWRWARNFRFKCFKPRGKRPRCCPCVVGGRVVNSRASNRAVAHPRFSSHGHRDRMCFTTTDMRR